MFLTGTIGSRCLYETMHSVLYSYTAIEAGVAPAGKTRLTAAGKWEQTRRTPVALDLGLGRRWKPYVLGRHFIRFPCSCAFPVRRRHQFRAGRGHRLEKPMGRVSSLQTHTPVRKSTMFSRVTESSVKVQHPAVSCMTPKSSTTLAI